MLLFLDSNEYIFGFGAFKKPACETLLDTIFDTFPTNSIRIPRLIAEEVGRHLTPEEFREFIGFITNLTTIDEDFVVPFELVRKKDGKLNLSACNSQADKTTTLSEDLTDYQKSCRKRWAALIRKIYEVDPLLCPKCGATMKIVSAIEDDIAIHKILSHLGLLHSPSRSPPPLITTPWKREPDYHSDYIPDIEVYCRDI